MPHRRTETVVNIALNLIGLFALLILSACQGQPEPASATPPPPPGTPSPTRQLEATATAFSFGYPSQTPTERLSKTPVLVSVIGKGAVYDTLWLDEDHTRFAVSASDAIRVYKAGSHEVIAEFPTAYGSSLQISPDGSKLVVSGSDPVQIYDLKQNKEIIAGQLDFRMRSLSFSNDGTRLAIAYYYSGSFNGPVYTWIEVFDLTSEQLLYVIDKDTTLEEPNNYYAQAIISPDGSLLLATERKSGRIKMWDMGTGELIARYLEHPFAQAIAFSPDGRWLVSAGGKEIRIWDAATNHLIRTISVDSPNLVNNLSFSEDGSQLIVELNDYTETINIIYDFSTGEKLDVPKNDETDEISDFLDEEGYFEIESPPLFSPDGSVLYIQDLEKILIWDVNTNQLISTIEQPTISTINRGIPQPVNRLAINPDGTLLAACQEDAVNVWDTRTGQQKESFAVQNAMAVSFSPDGSYLAVGGRQAVDLWDVQTGQQLWRTYLSGFLIQDLEFSDDDHSVIAASSSGWSVSWLDLRDGNVQKSLMLNKFEFDRFGTIDLQGSLLAAVVPDLRGQNSFNIWNVISGTVYKKVTSNYGGFYSESFDFSPDEKLIAGLGTGITKIWSTANGEPLFIFPEGHVMPVFSPDQQKIVLTDSLGRLGIWDISSLAERVPIPELSSALQSTPTAAPVTDLTESLIQEKCLDVAPELSPSREISGRLAIEGWRFSNPYLLDLESGERRALPKNIIELSTSPNGEWLAYEIFQQNIQRNDLIFEDTSGDQRVFTIKPEWEFPEWLGNNQLAYSFSYDYPIILFPPVQIITPYAGPYLQLASEYPDIVIFIGMGGTPYHFGTSSVLYDPSLRLAVYERLSEEHEYFLVLYDRQAGKILVEFPVFSFEQYDNRPIWSSDGQFFIAALIKGYNPVTTPNLFREDLFRIYRDGSVEQLTDFRDLPAQVGFRQGAISPDGKRYAFYFTDTVDQHEYTLAVMNLDTKEITLTCLKDGPYGAKLVWSPDGRYLVANEEYEAFTYRTILIDVENWQADQIIDDNSGLAVGWLNAP